MIFVGDIALPHKNAITFQNFPNHLQGKNWFGNLEGGIVQYDENKQFAVYNHREAIEELIREFNFKGFALANNHVLDSGTIISSLNFLDQMGINHVGAGINLQDAQQELRVEEDGVQLILVNFGWEVIQCVIADENNEGVNPLQRDHVLGTVLSLVGKYPNAKVIAFMHWNYELEREPQPFERELARKMIDLGAAGVIGCHPHRVGGYEIYKEKPILYSLGNWMFKQNHYFDGKLRFPDFCSKQLAFEWDFSSDTFQFHFFDYDRNSSSLTFLETTGEEAMLFYTPFSGLSSSEYEKWYRINHFHKNKGLPIYYWDDSDAMIRMKNRWMKIRDKVMKLVLNKGK